jgi:hypothetical protein
MILDPSWKSRVFTGSPLREAVAAGRAKIDGRRARG